MLAQADMLYACTHSYVCVSDILIGKKNFHMQFISVAELFFFFDLQFLPTYQIGVNILFIYLFKKKGILT